MKKVFYFLVIMLFLLFSGCQKEEKELEIPHYNYKGKIIAVNSEMNQRTFQSTANIWRDTKDLLFSYSAQEDSSTTTRENEVAKLKEFTFGGVTFQLRYIATVSKEGSKTILRYGLFTEDITEEMLNQVPADQRKYFTRNDSQKPIGVVSFVKDTGEVSLISNLPCGYFPRKEETEEHLKNKAMQFAGPYTTSDLETFNVSYSTFFIQGQDNMITTSDIHSIGDDESLEYYAVKFNRYIGNIKTNESVEVLFFGYGGMLIRFSNLSFTEAEKEKMAVINCTNILEQVNSCVSHSLQNKWKLVNAEVEQIAVTKIGGKLYLAAEISYKAKTSSKWVIQNDTYEFPLTLYAEII